MQIKVCILCIPYVLCVNFNLIDSIMESFIKSHKVSKSLQSTIVHQIESAWPLDIAWNRVSRNLASFNRFNGRPKKEKKAGCVVTNRRFAAMNQLNFQLGTECAILIEIL